MSFEAHLRAIIREEVAAVVADLKADLAAVKSAAKATVKKVVAATESAAPAATPAAAAATAPAAAPAAAPPAPPTYPAFETLKKAVLALAGINRQAAVDILGTFKVANASELKPEQFQAAIDALEEKKAAIDAAAAQASLV
jgi:hypothetical protein